MDAIGSCERKKSTDLDRFVREQMPAATANTESEAQGRPSLRLKKEIRPPRGLPRRVEAVYDRLFYPLCIVLGLSPIALLSVAIIMLP